MAEGLVSIKELRDSLKTMDDKELQNFVVDLFKLSRLNKEAATVRIKGKGYAEELMKEYEKRMERSFSRAKISFSEIKKPLSDFKTVCMGEFPELYIEFALFYIEKMIDFMEGYEYYEYDAENAIIRTFKSVCKFISKNQDLYEKFKEPLIELIKNPVVTDREISYWFADDFDDIKWAKQEYPQGILEFLWPH